MHDQSGHPVINTIYNSVQQRFTTKGIYASIEDYVSELTCLLLILPWWLPLLWSGFCEKLLTTTWIGKTCVVCQLTASLPPQPPRKLQPILPPDQPWLHIGIDLICDLPVTLNDCRHIFVTICYLSKYVVARGLKSKTSEEVLENLQDIYLDVGLPSDNYTAWSRKRVH